MCADRLSGANKFTSNWLRALDVEVRTGIGFETGRIVDQRIQGACAFADA